MTMNLFGSAKRGIRFLSVRAGIIAPNGEIKKTAGFETITGGKVYMLRFSLIVIEI